MKKKTAWYRAVATAALAVMLAVPFSARAARAVCTGDCDGNTTVNVNELITMVNIALGVAPVTTCSVGDLDGSGTIEVNEIITAVNFALTGCPPPNGEAVCGNKTVDAPDEDCDDGGICIGGSTAGTSCDSDAACGTGEPGICTDGSKDLYGCNSDTDCPDGKCVRCKTFGGDGCASNCTAEHDVAVNVKPGELLGTDIAPGTSGAVVHGDILTIPLPFTAGTAYTLTLGKERGPVGQTTIPGVIKATSVSFPAIPVSTLACACVRGVEFSSCGGTLFEIDGIASTNCTEGYGGGGAAACAGKKPCTPVLGAGNSGTGKVGCTSLDGVNFDVTQDAGGSTGVISPPVATLSGTGGPGSGVILNTNAIGTVVGLCAGTTADYGADGNYCTDDDPNTARGTAAAAPSVTGTATATLFRANGVDDNTVGPYSYTGIPLSCSNLAAGSASGGALAGAFTQIGAQTVGDIVVRNLQIAQ